ncbi:MAG: carboxypeptidase-like regulatory domain-containing protein, partial [Bacteroidota bacterium]
MCDVAVASGARGEARRLPVSSAPRPIPLQPAAPEADTHPSAGPTPGHARGPRPGRCGVLSCRAHSPQVPIGPFGTSSATFRSADFRVMTRLLLLAALAALLPASATAQVWGEIAGTVTQAADGEPIPGANVLVEGTNFGTAASVDGRFSFRIPEGTYPVAVSAVGFATARDTVRVRKGQRVALDVALVEAELGLGEAEVTAERAGLGAGISPRTPAEVRAMPTPV